MGLFFYEDEAKYTLKGTSNWEYSKNIQKKSLINGVFYEKDPRGLVKSLNLSCDEETIYFNDK